MRVLVTGGSGYIGSRVMRALAARPDIEELIDVDVRAPSSPIDKVTHIARSVTESLDDLFVGDSRGVDVALHLAWNVDPLRDGMRQRLVCIGGTQRFLDGCAAGNVKHVLFVSSATAYGAHPAHARPVDEDEPLKDRYHFQYSAEKREAEGLFRRFATDRPGTLLQIVRPCIVGGPNVSNYIFRSIDRRVSVRVAGHDPHLQLVHEDDCADAIAAIIASKAPGAFNIAPDDGLALTKMIERASAPSVAVPLRVARAIAQTAWNRGWTSITEAPADFVWFIAYPWCVSGTRGRREAGVAYRYSCGDVLDQFLASRKR
jgi:UDP-glucose 4-epimerase